MSIPAFALPEFLNSVVLGLGVTILFTYYYLTLKPKLELVSAEIQTIKTLDQKEHKVLRVLVKNNNHQHNWYRFFLKNKSILNVSIEACFLEGNKTYHLKFDENQFLFIPPCECCNKNEKQSERYFVTDSISEQLEIYFVRRNIPQIKFNDLIESKYPLRVRVFGNDELTGQGIAIEKKFEYPFKQTNA